ncbi:MAG: hypothetical protein HY735_24420 [Verrucomicrobia bacterium]|nr:hypothetical protein [Verrucomicrobiota bacterium]
MVKGAIPKLVAQTCSLSVSPEIVASRYDFSGARPSRPPRPHTEGEARRFSDASGFRSRCGLEGRAPFWLRLCRVALYRDSFSVQTDSSGAWVCHFAPADLPLATFRLEHPDYAETTVALASERGIPAHDLQLVSIKTLLAHQAGSFRIEDVLPGEYEISFVFRVTSGGMAEPRARPPVGHFRKDVIVPPYVAMKGEPVDLGTIVIPGEAFPRL